MMRRILLGVLLVLTPLTARAADRPFVNGEPVTLDPAQGYVLVRSFQREGGALRGTESFSPLLYRVVGDDVLAQARAARAADPENWQDTLESNVVSPPATKPYVVVKGEVYLLTTLKPGTYVLGGLEMGNWITVDSGAMSTSLCMGTVKFEVKPGVITDLGSLLTAPDDRPTDIPELAGVVTGKDMDDGALLTAMALRIVPDDVPAALAALPRVQADYHAVGFIPNYSGGPLGRLAPLAGVLDYDKDGNVIDLKAAPHP